MLKIYIHTTCIILTSFKNLNQVQSLAPGMVVLDNLQQLSSLIPYWESQPTSCVQATFCIPHMSFAKLKTAFFSHYELHPAGGGLVVNETGEVLMILRNDTWDLPKGHAEAGETMKTTSLREVEEETGVSRQQDGLKIVRPLVLGKEQKHATYHTYISKKGKRVLKQSFWYEMSCVGSPLLVPQTEEGIEEVMWANREQLALCMENTYANIGDVVAAYLALPS